MKQEDCSVTEPNVSQPEPVTLNESDIATPRPRPRGRPPKKKNLDPATTNEPVIPTDSVVESTPETPTPVRKKRGRPRGSTRSARNANSGSKPVTKAGIAGQAETDTYSYSDLFMADDDQDVDENVDAGDEDSEYAPSDEEVARRIAETPRRRRGVSASTRRHSKNKAARDEVEDEGGSTDEDEAGESETEDEEDEDEEFGDSNLNDQVANGVPVSLFEDDNNQQRDIYDFDAQSIISDKRVTSMRKRAAAATATRTTRSSRRIILECVPVGVPIFIVLWPPLSKLVLIWMPILVFSNVIF